MKPVTLSPATPPTAGGLRTEARVQQQAGDRGLAVLLFTLGALVAATAVLGPLVLDVLHYRTSASGLDQIRGTDLTALALVYPLCVWVGMHAWRGHPAAPVLALAPAVFTVYIWIQLLLGSEFDQPGNVEWFFPLLLGTVGLGIAVAVRATRLLRSQPPLRWSRPMERSTGILLLLVVGFVVVGIHLTSLLDALSDHPIGDGVLTTPNAFWVVKAMDLGLVAPASLLMAVGLLRGHPWARSPAAAVLGGYALLGWSVAAMAWSLVLGGAVDASPGLAVGATALAVAVTGYATVIYRPLFRRTTPAPASGPPITRTAAVALRPHCEADDMSPSASVLPRNPVTLSVPLRGPCRVQNSPASRVPSHGTDAFGSAYAIDLVPVDEHGRSAPRTWRGLVAAEPPEIFVGFGRPILAPVSGIVALIHDGEPDHAARRSQLALVPYMLRQPQRARLGAPGLAGNHVVIAIGSGGPFVLLAHLQQGSVQVQRGQAVSMGVPVARCGNSGNSTEPHVHLQVSDSMDWTSARGLPFAFGRVDGTAWLPTNSQIVRN